VGPSLAHGTCQNRADDDPDASLMPARTIPLDGPLDLGRTLAIHSRGPGDTLMRIARADVIRATRKQDGTTKMQHKQSRNELKVET
jgi:hypothetical protein